MGAHGAASPDRDVRCHVCKGLLEGGEPEGLVLGWGVSSDCQPVRTPAEFCWCRECFTVQPRVGAAWRAEADRIYASYQTYAAAGGVEQMSMDPSGGVPARRSRIIVDSLRTTGVLGDVRSILDVGCGRGAFLEAFAGAFPGALLHGYEIDERNREAVESMAGGATFHTGALGDLRDRFDVISLIHVLEHIESPAAFLGSLSSLLRPRGRIIVQVPAWQANPFALTIKDHATHFTEVALRHIAARAGATVEAGPSDWVAKELTMVAARPAGPSGATRPAVAEAEAAIVDLRTAVAWLKAVSTEAGRLAEACPTFGIFGTAVAGTWVATPWIDRVAFFVDEDPSRVGSRHLGRPIIAPGEVPAGSDVYVPLAPVVAGPLMGRLAPRCAGHLRPAPALAD